MVNDRDYIYACSRVRAADGALGSTGRLKRMLEAADTAELFSIVKAFAPKGDYVSVDSAGEAMLSGVVRCVLDASPDKELLAPVLYKYDCNNIKIAIKSKLRGVSADDLYFDCGTVSPDTVRRAVREEKYSLLPDNMGRAAYEAVRAYERSGDGRIIDLILDRGCFEDMDAGARKGGVKYIIDLVRIAADSANILSALRIGSSELDAEVKMSLLESAYVPGGDVGLYSLLSEDKTCSLEEIAGNIMNSPLSGAVREAYEKNYTVSQTEKLFKSVADNITEEMKRKSFGPEVLAAYIVSAESEVRKCRIIKAALEKGIDREQIPSLF